MTRKLQGGKLVIATHNAGKLKEIGALLAPYGLECVSAGQLGLPEPEETGTTFAENALIKAHAAAKAAQLPALSDDSGLSVAALDGRPGVYTADWAERQWFEGEPGRDWFMAMGKVEGLLAEKGPDADRSCWFSCTLAIAWPDGEEVVYEGRVNGTFSWPPRGRVGFGYDPVFVPEGKTVTFAEMEPADKQAMSHRADAFAKLVAEQFGS
ncbi:RdgB/HAM1 family non-canonical purine NTP pyrophosphatase [Novosphingobium mangrovi (ex Hu et al. 2023)]|uniref:dITP/XTP pyrophosphatase n=1 Tax=Novosphingobium mangrovi (ex Hu et al. 2023) TaxID=2930094 RepID=A0ABT0A9I2_9SPHN|nr:RdgB/HAM1 family non-canonical purine NTP pyrophosphatase [Novosphingobium mangrovi (ex Hu et al. 2023)]MCJ1959855.1 RdgB/HAM1 family non-canonical purine NTP pyrophosphatase [Novosphingobium mangrovi (ex Hu et al. 2023)]MED5546625.1 RdgB/HAM1 family non-canonical purine NTP pyrophosphatase [Pseudomonadota bacterium]